MMILYSSEWRIHTITALSAPYSTIFLTDSGSENLNFAARAKRSFKRAPEIVNYNTSTEIDTRVQLSRWEGYEEVPGAIALLKEETTSKTLIGTGLGFRKRKVTHLGGCQKTQAMIMEAKPPGHN
jgi:hypothetical protein